MTPSGSPSTSAKNPVGRPETTATRANIAASSLSSVGDARQRPGPGRVRDDGGERAVEVEEQGGAPRVGRKGPQQRGEACRGVARDGQRQEAGRRRRGQVLADDHDHVGAGDPTDRSGGRERQDLRRLDADGGRDGCRLLLEAGCVVDGRRRLRRRGVDGRLHRPAASTDDGRVVGRQTVGVRAVGHDDAHRSGRDGGGRRGVTAVMPRRRGASWSWSVVAVVVVAAPAAVVVVLAARQRGGRRRRRGAVAGSPLTLGRVPTATRTATATTKRIRTAAARTTESEPDVPDGGRSFVTRGPACRAPPPGASLSRWSPGRGVAACSLGAAPE